MKGNQNAAVTFSTQAVYHPAMLVLKRSAGNQWLHERREYINETERSGSLLRIKRKGKEMFYLTTHSTHFIYGYMEGTC